MTPEQQQQFNEVIAQVGAIQTTLEDLGYSFSKKTGPGYGTVSGSLPTQSPNFVSGSVGWRLTPAGDFEANSGTFRGSLEANSIDIPDTVTANSFHVDAQGNAWWGATAVGSAVAKILKDGAATFTNITITGGSVVTSVLNTSVQRATSDIAFSVTDNDTIAWSSGTIRNAVGNTWSISSGNTGNMSALTYIYLDIAVSVTVLQTTTSYSTAVGDGKILVAVAQNASSGGAMVVPYLGATPLLNGAAQINASSILAAQLSVSQLSAITANLGTITAGTITVDTAGYIRGGSTDYLTSTGFFLGYSGAAYKFSVGDPSGNYIAWDGSKLNIGGKIGFGGDGSDGALSISSGTTTIDCAGAAYVIKYYTSISITGTAQLAFSNPHANGTVVILKSQGNVTITSSTNPAIDLRQIGGTGGQPGAAAGFQANGGDGNDGSGAPTYPTGGIGGPQAATVAGATPDASRVSRGNQASAPTARSTPAFAGSGGGAGGQGSGSTCLGGTGGTGGGGLLIECGGALNITSTINASGQNGTNAAGPGSGGGNCAGGATGGAGRKPGVLGTAPATTAVSASGGAGGGGGSIIILYKTLTADSGTYNVTGGNAGTSTANAGTSGTGGDGLSSVLPNTFFV